MSVLNVNLDNFEELVANSKIPVILDFWAPWCGPCKMMSAILDQAAEEAVEYAAIAKVNIDEEPELAAAFGVMSIPTLIVVQDGEIQSELVGLQNKRTVKRLLEVS